MRITNILLERGESVSFLSARKKAGLTQKEVAAAVGVDQSAVSFWETGAFSPRAAVLLKVARLYGCTVDELLTADRKSGQAFRDKEH